MMEVEYFVVNNDPKKGEIVAAMVTDRVAAGGVVISATGTKDAVHYVIGNVPEDPAALQQMSDEEMQIMLDNLDAEKKAEKRDE